MNRTAPFTIRHPKATTVAVWLFVLAMFLLSWAVVIGFGIELAKITAELWSLLASPA